jgi:glutamine---fructose-6-phosphate transaminase (isomerizing)
MCGIFGLVSSNTANFDATWTERAVRTLMRLSESRGKESMGLAFRTPDSLRVFKSSGRASSVVKTTPFKNFLRSTFDEIPVKNGVFDAPLAFLGHCRLVTNGHRSFEDNNQPVISRNSVGVHNGIVVNEAALWEQHGDLPHETDVDSEVIFRLIDQEVDRSNSVPAAISSAFSQICGVANIAMLRTDTSTIELATNNGSLYFCHVTGKNCVVFASERYILRKALARMELSAADEQIRHLQAGQAVSLSYLDASVSSYSLQSPPANQAPGKESQVPIVWRRPQRSMMRRCARCVLPETFPGISFDSSGVCSVCHSHEAKAEHGRDELERIIAPYRSRNGEADCIVAFSGGRDSSYGLHYIKRELGMNPIAYTYDWGMVTDLARRNISRLCAKLEVEHLLRSTDIRAKRRNIRKNIEAWLHRPELGMIPLFMAGDKQFYHYGRQTRKETGLPLVFFCGGNELERTEFKSGFCGVRESKHGQVLWKFSIRNKVQLAAYYAMQYLRNPRYFNISFFDTLFAFYSTYVARDDFLYLYHYIPWNEAEIASTLRDEYGWEDAATFKNTWRIGDGTAAFYNYIYNTMAGFSEHDTFRSNQVRSGVISRADAIQLVEQDNRPRWDAMQEYAELVGFNLEEALVVINSAPKLYDKP